MNEITTFILSALKCCQGCNYGKRFNISHNTLRNRSLHKVKNKSFYCLYYRYILILFYSKYAKTINKKFFKIDFNIKYSLISFVKNQILHTYICICLYICNIFLKFNLSKFNLLMNPKIYYSSVWFGMFMCIKLFMNNLFSIFHLL